MKFGRRCQLSVEVNPSTTPGSDFAEGRNNIVIPPEKTIEFEISRQSLGSSQEAVFRVLNLGEKTRNLIFKDPYALTEYRAIQFRAGYADQPFLPLCFNGFVRSATSSRPGDDWVTEISAYDGGLQMANAFTAQTIASGQSVAETLKLLANSLPRVAGAPVIGEFPATNKRGKVLFGPTWNVILQESQGLAVFDNGQVKILNVDEAIAAEIPVINADSGLIGSPRRTQTSLEIETLLETRLTLGQIVKLESLTNKFFNGLYKVMGFTHRGTISPAVGGNCTTTISLFYGAGEFRNVQANLVQ